MVEKLFLSAHKAVIQNDISHVPTFANFSISFPLFLFGYVPYLTELVIKET